MPDIAESDNPAGITTPYIRSPGKRVRPAKMRRNTERNKVLKPRIAYKRKAPNAGVVIEDDPAFFTDVTHSISYDSDIPSYVDEDSAGHYHVMLSTVQMVKEQSQSMQSMELPMTNEHKMGGGYVPAIPTTPAEAATPTASSETNFVQLAFDFKLSRARMRHVLDEMRRFHDERNRPPPPTTLMRPWRVLLFTMVLLFLLRFTYHLQYAFAASCNLMFPPVAEIVEEEEPESLDLHTLRFIEYYRPV